MPVPSLSRFAPKVALLALGWALTALPLSGCYFVGPQATDGGSEDAEAEASSQGTGSAEAGSTSASTTTDSDSATSTATGSSTTDGGEESTTGDPGPGEMRVATFNVRLFFDQICQSGFCGNGGFEEVPTAEQFQARVVQIAAAVRELDAHVVLLQEIENEYCLNALMAELGGDGYLDAVIGETGNDASIDVATISKISFSDVLYHGSQALPLPGGGTTWFAREFLEVRFEFGGKPVSVFNGHFKSKADDDPARRLAEATVAERIVTDRADAIPDGAVVFGGDLNDTPGSAPINVLESTGELFRVASELTQDATHQYQGNQEAIDHLFVATAPTGGEYISGSAQIFYGSFWGFGGSDHAAVRASLLVGSP